MNTDTEIREKGMRALIEALGPVDSARFVSLALREPFDYSKWRKEEFANETLETLMEKIRISEKTQKVTDMIS